MTTQATWCACLHRAARHTDDGVGSCQVTVRPILLSGWGPSQGEAQPCGCREFQPQPPDDDDDDDDDDDE